MKDKTDFVLRAAAIIYRDGMAAPAQEDLPWSEQETDRLMGIAIDLAVKAVRDVDDESQ